jgi:hypothetical protein
MYDGPSLHGSCCPPPLMRTGMGPQLSRKAAPSMLMQGTPFFVRIRLVRERPWSINAIVCKSNNINKQTTNKQANFAISFSTGLLKLFLFWFACGAFIFACFFGVLLLWAWRPP